MALSANQRTRIAVGGPGLRYAGFTAKAEDVGGGTSPRGTVGPFTRLAVGGPGLRYPGFTAKGTAPTPTPTPTGQVDTHDGGERKVWYQRTYREPTKRELRSAIDRLPAEVVAELEALAEPQVQDSVYKPLELRIDIEELMCRTELAYQVMEAARLSDEEDDDFLLLT